jgi:hypothetical protein
MEWLKNNNKKHLNISEEEKNIRMRNPRCRNKQFLLKGLLQAHDTGVYIKPVGNID